MPDAGVIQEFLVGIGFRVNQTQQQQFTKGVAGAGQATAALNQQLASLHQAIGKLGQAFIQFGGTPTSNFVTGTNKIGLAVQALKKGALDLTKTIAAAGGTFVTALFAIGKQYEQLYYIAQRTGASVAGLQAFSDAFARIGIAGDAALEGLSQFHARLRDQFGYKQLVESMVPQSAIDEVKKRNEGFITDEEALYLAALQTLANMAPDARRIYSTLWGIDPATVERFRLNRAEFEKGLTATREAIKLAFGPDAQTALNRHNKIVQDAVNLQRTWDKLLVDFGALWTQIFGDAVQPLTHLIETVDGLLKKLIEFNRLHPGAAWVEGFAAAAVGATALLGVLNLLTGRLLLLNPYFVAFAGAAALIMSNWEPVSKFFEDHLQKIEDDFKKHDWKKLGADIWTAITDAFTGVDIGKSEERMVKAGQEFIANFFRGVWEGIQNDPSIKAIEDLFDTLFGWPQRLHEKLFGGMAPAVPATPAAPGGAAGAAPAAPHFQRGGIVTINAHEGEMVLPATISRGLQRMLGQPGETPRLPLGEEERANAMRRSLDALGEWLAGVGLVPKVEVENPEDFPGGVFTGAPREGAERGRAEGQPESATVQGPPIPRTGDINQPPEIGPGMEPGPGGPNPFLATERAPYKEELEKNPDLMKELSALVDLENPRAGTAVVESLFNRLAWLKSRGKTMTVEQMMHSGFYGPEKRGEVLPHLRELSQERLTALTAKVNQALAGSDIIRSFTDQGSRGDPNYERGGIGINLNRERFNYFGGDTPETRAWRQQREEQIQRSIDTLQTSPAPTSRIDTLQMSPAPTSLNLQMPWDRIQDASDQLDRISRSQPLGGDRGDIYNNGGDRNVNMNVTHNLTVNGDGGGDAVGRYAGAARRLYGDLQRDLQTNIA